MEDKKHRTNKDEEFVASIKKQLKDYEDRKATGCRYYRMLKNLIKDEVETE